MARNDPLASISTRRTPQREQARADQVKNNAGGYTFQVAGEDRLRRFLILGTEGGTYYTSQAELTKDNAKIVLGYAQNDPRKLVDVAVEISVAGRAPKQNPAIFALAAAARTAPNAEDRAYALAQVGKVCRTGTTLFLFAQYCEQFAGWGKGLRKAVSRWYTEPSLDKVALQAVKYRQRNGWTHRDLLRLAHPKTEDPARKALFDFISGRPDFDALPPIVQDFIELQKTTNAKAAARIIADGHGVTWELLPTQLLNEKDVWVALIDQGLPLNALIRQLPRLTNLGVLNDQAVRSRILLDLSNQEAITRSRVHPVNVLLAAKTYQSGHGERGKLSWSPNRHVVDALDGVFYKAFGNVEPSGKRTLLALDVSGSMAASAGGLPISCIEAEAAISLVTMATEPQVDIVGFTSGGWTPSSPSRRSRGWGYGSAISELNISPRQRLDDVVRTIARYPMGGTDCALPFQWAQANDREYDTVVVFTDNETWAGGVHPHQALEDYRRSSGINTRSVVAAFASTGFTIADPNDPDSLDIVGLDSAVPNLIADFSRGL